jgi:hypothetical protein
MTSQSPSVVALAKAMLEAQKVLKPAIKDSANPFFKSKYADLGSVWDACREALHANGLSVVQFPGFEQGVATLTTILLHTSGEWIAGTAGAPLVKQDAQSAGSVITYLRRYALAAAVGVVTEDDDGQAGSQAPKPKRAEAPRPTPGVTPASAPAESTTERKLASQTKGDMLRAAVAKAGIKGSDWPDFYRSVLAREYDGKLYDVDVPFLLDAVVRRASPATASVESGPKDEGSGRAQLPPRVPTA